MWFQWTWSWQKTFSLSLTIRVQEPMQSVDFGVHFGSIQQASKSFQLQNYYWRVFSWSQGVQYHIIAGHESLHTPFLCSTSKFAAHIWACEGMKHQNDQLMHGVIPWEIGLIAIFLFSFPFPVRKKSQQLGMDTCKSLLEQEKSLNR